MFTNSPVTWCNRDVISRNSCKEYQPAVFFVSVIKLCHFSHDLGSMSNGVDTLSLGVCEHRRLNYFLDVEAQYDQPRDRSENKHFDDVLCKNRFH